MDERLEAMQHQLDGGLGAVQQQLDHIVQLMTAKG
jgi:hypothetical protein